MKFKTLLLLVSTLLGCNALNNKSQFNRVDCGDAVNEDYFYVLDSKKNRLGPAEFQILVRRGNSQSISSLPSTSKGCFSKDSVGENDTLLVKALSLNEAQVVSPELIHGRTPIVLQTLSDKKPSIVCNHNLVDSTLFLNQFINFNDAKFLEFYNISASVSINGQLVDATEPRPLLNSGTYDLKSLIRGKIYMLDLKIQDFVYSNGSLMSTPCDLDMDIPNLSAKLGDEIKEFRNYFGESYGVVDQGYELNFYIEGGLKTVSIDYCLLRIDPAQNVALPRDASCSDFDVPTKSYAKSEKGERFDSGFWLVLYRYKKGLLTKPWVAQKIMVRKVCETALYKTEDLDRNLCTDISGNINAEGENFKGSLEIKYASVLLGQLYVASTNYQSISLPNLEFASQIDIQYNNLLERISLPRLSQVSLGFNLAENLELHDISHLGSLQRVGNVFNLLNTKLQTLAGLENLKVVGNQFLIVNNSRLTDLDNLQSLEFVGGDFVVDGNMVLKSIDGLKRLNFIGRSMQISSNSLLESAKFNSIQDHRLEISIRANPRLVSLTGLENIKNLNGLEIRSNEDLSDLATFENIISLGTGMVIGNCPMISDLTDFKSLNQAGSLTFENLSGLKSFAGLQNITQLDALIITNSSGLTDLTGLENLQRASRLYITKNENLQTIDGLDSLSDTDLILTISDNPKLKTLAGTLMSAKEIDSIQIENNTALKDLAILNTVETTDSLKIKFNRDLASLAGLTNLKMVKYDFEIVNNMALKSLEGLSMLASIGRDFLLDNNWYLESLKGLYALAKIGGNLEIISSGRLENLKGLEALKTVKGRITLRSNLNLKSLEGLSGLESVGGGFLFQYSDALKNPCSVFQAPEKVSCKDNR